MQRISGLPIDQALAILDRVMAPDPRVRVTWDVAGTRALLLAAARDGFIETGTAKRILAAAERPQLSPSSNQGMRQIIQLWNGIKTILPSQEG